LNYRIKLLLLFLCALGTIFVFTTGYAVVDTLSRLNVVETDRDAWQKPAEVIDALHLSPGDTVFDLGCGSGYFSIRLSSVVGKNGKVLAEDIRRLPLFFLWLRTFWQNSNVHTVHGAPLDPRLPAIGANAVLIANTYHELSDSRPILSAIAKSLTAGGRLVIVDRQPAPPRAGETGALDHAIPLSQVEREVQQAGFSVVVQDDRFIEQDPGRESWWLLVARKSDSATGLP